MSDQEWPWQERDPQEYALHMKGQTEGVRDEIGKLIDIIVDSTPGADWPDDQAPRVGDPGFLLVHS